MKFQLVMLLATIFSQVFATYQHQHEVFKRSQKFIVDEEECLQYEKAQWCLFSVQDADGLVLEGGDCCKIEAQCVENNGCYVEDSFLPEEDK